MLKCKKNTHHFRNSNITLEPNQEEKKKTSTFNWRDEKRMNKSWNAKTL